MPGYVRDVSRFSPLKFPVPTAGAKQGTARPGTNLESFQCARCIQGVPDWWINVVNLENPEMPNASRE